MSGNGAGGPGGDVITGDDHVERFVIDAISVQLEGRSEAVLGLSDKVNGLGLDSIDNVEVIMKIEDKYGIKINDDDARDLTSEGKAIGDIVDYVKNRVQSGV